MKKYSKIRKKLTQIYVCDDVRNRADFPDYSRCSTNDALKSQSGSKCATIIRKSNCHMWDERDR